MDMYTESTRRKGELCAASSDDKQQSQINEMDLLMGTQRKEEARFGELSFARTHVMTITTKVAGCEGYIVLARGSSVVNSPEVRFSRDRARDLRQSTSIIAKKGGRE